jgi:class 3 adenylate cyclase
VRLRRKITIAFFGVSALVAVLLAWFLYHFIEDTLAEDLRARLDDIAHVGAHAIDLDAYRTLTTELAALDATGELDDAAVTRVEDSPAFRTIYAQLRNIRQAEPRLIRFVYLLTPTEDPDRPRFVVDADVLELVAQAARGAPPQEISHFGEPYDVRELPLLRKALLDCTPELEPALVYDEVYSVSSLSAYRPLSGYDGQPLRDASGRCLGVLGIDMIDADLRAALEAAGSLAVKISLAVVIVALVVSIVMGTLLTRSVLALSATVKRFAARDFSARTPALPRDEIGQLGENFNSMADTIQIHSERLEDLVEQRTKELSAEKQTSERLLRNVLPGPIAERLKTGERMIVDRFEAVTVLFADIVGFTALSSRTSPEELVTMLNELFSTFDRLAEKHGIEKIKTIGDAYMVVAGIPEPIEDHAVKMAHMALDMLDAITAYATRTRTELTIRVGLHSGSVVAGVIGQKKFIYDLWGDTVNTASRMESAGLPGRIHVSEATYELLRDQFELESRGPIEIKGKGIMTTYLLVAPKPHVAARAASASPA